MVRDLSGTPLRLRHAPRFQTIPVQTYDGLPISADDQADWYANAISFSIACPLLLSGDPVDRVRVLAAVGVPTGAHR
jgi:hypothetical protein